MARLFKVKVVLKHPFEETIEVKLTAKDDAQARKNAVGLALAKFNASQDEWYRNDKDTWRRGDAPLKKLDYRHANPTHIDYCEVTLQDEW